MEAANIALDGPDRGAYLARMHQSEAAQLEICASCGTEVLSIERAYAFEESVVCYECSLARGGAYDEVHDRWTRTPDVADLLSADAV
jgi:hypothetical protein